ncbi:Lrp/AsnC family transcriptional regulator [Streptacidiphilus sp. PAMC 29251]
MPAEQMAGPGEPRAGRRVPLPALRTGPAAEWVAERTRQRASSARVPIAGRAAGEPPKPSDESMVEQRQLDRIDRAILRLLQQDGRASIRSVAERVHVSRANAYARIARMVDDGVIRGFTARVDHERAGQAASAYITLKIVQNSWRRVRGQLLELPGVEHMALVSGDFDVLLLVHTVDNRALRELVLNRIQSIPEVLGTHTLLVFDETDRTPVLPD